jgi:glutamyl-tRNA synthetase
VPVLVNEQRKKLSKRRDKVALEQYRDEGFLAEAMVNYLMTLGWAPAGDEEIVPWALIERTFRLEDVNHSPAFFDVKKLRAFNGDYIRALPLEQFIDRCQPWLTGTDAPWPTERFDAAVFEAVAELVQTRVATLGEVPGMVDFFFVEPTVDVDALRKATSTVAGRAVLEEFTAACADVVWEHAALHALLEGIGTAHELKLGKAQAPVRIAVTGRTVGPPLFESLEVLGRGVVLARLRTAIGLA